MGYESTMIRGFGLATGILGGGDTDASAGARVTDTDAPREPARAAGMPSAGKLAEQSHFAALLARMAQRDEAALGALYDAAIGRVYGFALRIVGNAPAAEEIASDVFLQAWKDAARYDAARAKVLTWLLMICRSRALDWLRGRDTAILHDAPETLIEELPSGDSPQDLLEAIQSNSTVHSALERLTPDATPARRARVLPRHVASRDRRSRANAARHREESY